MLTLCVTLLHECFSRFFKLYKWYQIVQCHIETRQLIFSAVQINCPNFIMTKLALTH